MTRKIRVTMASTSYPKDAGDWRSIFIRHLTFAIARQDEIKLQVWAPPGGLPGNTTSIATNSESIWLESLMSRGGIAKVLRQKKISSIKDAAVLLRMLNSAFKRCETETDLYHLNWLQTILPMPQNTIPALVTVLGSDMGLLKLPFMHACLRRAFKRRRVAICPNADWMVAPLEKAFGNKCIVKCIPFGVDDDWYSLQRKQLTEEQSHWLTVLRVTHKKIGPLFDWGARYFTDSGRVLHLFGPMQEPIDIPRWVEYHGPVTSKELLERWFPIAKGLVTLSQHDEGRPQIILEAMAAGLPIIASRIPAHENLLRQDDTGYLCTTQAQFEQSLLALEDNSTNIEMGQRGKTYVKKSFGTWDDCAARYHEMYRILLKDE